MVLFKKINVDEKQDKLTAGTNITIADNVISASGGGGTPTNMVTTDTAQSITGIKNFNNGLKTNLIELSGRDLVIKNSSTSAAYIDVTQFYNGTGFKNYFGFLLKRDINGVTEVLSQIIVRDDEVLYVVSQNGVTFQTPNILFGNSRLQQVGTPTTDSDAATKKYVDDAIKAALKP